MRTTHIAEGFLPPFWAVFWTLVTAIVLIWAVGKVRHTLRERPEQKMLMAISGAFIFVLSSLKLPSVTGSSSHPTGTGMATMLYGVAVTSVLSLIVLSFQALLLAHGGITTLGANVFSMGIAGPFVAYLAYTGLRKLKFRLSILVFVTAFIADITTYLVTALQLALAYPSGGGVLPSFEVFAGIFAITQIPLAIIEGILTVMFFDVLARTRPELIDAPIPERKLGGRAKYAVASCVILAILALALVLNTGSFAGTDDLGVGKITELAPGYSPWFSLGLNVPSNLQAPLFLLQAIMGLAIITFVLMRTRRRFKEGKG